MIISDKYGPQFDPRDGTIGDLMLVVRWCLRTPEHGLWGARQGRYTRATKEEAEEWLTDLRRGNRPELVPASLMVAPYWCYPEGFDPIAQVEALTWNVALDKVIGDQRFVICQMLTKEIDAEKPEVILTVNVIDGQIVKWVPTPSEEKWTTKNRQAIERDLFELIAEEVPA